MIEVKIDVLVTDEAWKKDLKAIRGGFSEEVTFKLDLEGWVGVYQLDNVKRVVHGKAGVNDWMNKWKKYIRRKFKGKQAFQWEKALTSKPLENVERNLWVTVLWLYAPLTVQLQNNYRLRKWSAFKYGQKPSAEVINPKPFQTQTFMGVKHPRNSQNHVQRRPVS